jgi:hypothetical protein
MADMRKIVILTSGLIRFEAEADRYITESVLDHSTTSVEIIRDNEAVARFPDVHAVWFDDSVQLIPPEEN